MTVAENEIVEIVQASTLLTTQEVGACPPSGSHPTPLNDVSNAGNVTLTGGGTIDGQGGPWWNTIKAENQADQTLSPRPGLLSITDVHN